jgi:hypothetical protein
VDNAGRNTGAGAVVAAVAIFVGHQAGVVGKIFGESTAWRSLGKSLSAVDQDVPELKASLSTARESGGDDALLAGMLCDAATSAVNEDPPSVEDFVSSELEQAAAGLSLSDKIDEFEAGLRLSQWNGGVAAKYMQACVFRS